MGTLKREPSGQVASAEELMAVAHALEQEASLQYRRLSERMRNEGEDALAKLFDSLSRIEEKHTEQIDARALTVIGKKPDPTLVRWELPENFDEEDVRSYRLTPYRAFAIAVRNEERAFAFYSYLAAYAEDDRVRQLAEDCAEDELDHAALLRRERRKAWRLERDAAVGMLRRVTRVLSVDELLNDIAVSERAAANAHRALAAELTTAGDTYAARLFEETATDEEARAKDAEHRLGRASTVPPQSAPTLRTTREGLRLLEESFEHYSELAEHAVDEACMSESQALAARSLRQLSYVQGSINNALISAASGSPPEIGQS